MNKTIVMKFGGAAVAAPEKFSMIADAIIRRKQEYDRVIVVVSAMGNTTNDLIELAKKVHPNPPQREYDMLVTVGERISIALLAMALSLKGQEAISFTGSQSGIITSDTHTSAKIIDVKAHRLVKHLDEGRTVIVAGFQGCSKKGEITTLGRGGSDTTAVALAIAFKADKVEFYKDVQGVYNQDPKVNPDAERLDCLTYDEALNIIKNGAKVLSYRCVELAQQNNVPLYVRSFLTAEESGTVIGEMTAKMRDPPCFEQELQLCEV